MDYVIKNEELTVTVSDCGAQLMSILKNDGTEYLWQGDPAFWHDRAPVLFPFIARLNQGKYIYKGNEYSMRIHGFAKYMNFLVTEQKTDSITLTLKSNEETLSVYPFLFEFSCRYSLNGNKVLHEFIVKNLGDNTMYYAVGGHHGFNVPMTAGRSFEEYHLTFDRPCKPQRVGFDDQVLVNGELSDYPLSDDTKLPLRHDLFDHDAVVLQKTSEKVTIESDKDSRSVSVTFKGFPNVGFWHAVKKEAPYVCVEPWSALPASNNGITDFEEKKDLTALKTGETNIHTIEIEIR